MQSLPDMADTYLDVQIVGMVDIDAISLQPRQVPIEADEEAAMVLQLGAPNIYEDQLKRANELERQGDPEYNLFLDKFTLLEPQVLAQCLSRDQADLFSLLGDLPCVGCRRAAETLYQHIATTAYSTLDPVVLQPKQKTFTLRKEYLQCPMKLYSVLYLQKRRFDCLVDNIPKQRKNKRCNLHCLDSHKIKSLSMWMDVWSMITNEDCREEVVLVGFDALLDTLEAYLHKHRFCLECKSKVQRAYDIMIGAESPPKEEKDFQPQLFENIRVCSAERHIHLPCSDLSQLSAIINRAEAELATCGQLGSMDMSRRERHAKTIDVAQEEVLTCLGIHLYDKLHKLGQKIRSEEQTWLLLVHACFESLKRGFETAIEKTRGFSNLELFCQEYESQEKAAAARKEQKREKKKARRNKSKNTAAITAPVPVSSSASTQGAQGCADCGSASSRRSCQSGGHHSVSQNSRSESSSASSSIGSASFVSKRHRHTAGGGGRVVVAAPAEDGGYHSHSSSGRGDSAEPSDGSASGGSRGSPGSVRGHRRGGSGGSSGLGISPQRPLHRPTSDTDLHSQRHKCSALPISLCAMLDDKECFGEYFPDETDSALPDSVVNEFLSQKPEIDRKRRELRSALRLKFEAMASSSRD